MRYFTSGFLRQRAPSGPNRHAQERFQIFSNFLGEMQKILCFAGVIDTGEASFTSVVDNGEELLTRINDTGK